MELERMHTENENQRAIRIKYFGKLERRNWEKDLIWGGWRVCFLMEVQSNIGYGNVYDICHYNFESRIIILISIWYNWMLVKTACNTRSVVTFPESTLYALCEITPPIWMQAVAKLIAFWNLLRVSVKLWLLFPRLARVKKIPSCYEHNYFVNFRLL